ncbi:MAG: T9SS type A sorting domain-containing protein [Ignavibacteriaceae bacterium]
MINKKYVHILTFIIFCGFISFGFTSGEKNNDEKKRFNKTNTNDDHKYIAINQIFMWVSNNGDGSHDPRTDGSGFYWPGGENAKIAAIFEDGLIWGAKVGRETRVNGSTYRHGLQAGKILPNGEATNPNDVKYRVYKIRKGWEGLPPGPIRDAFEKDYNEWPFDDGAPYVFDKSGNKVPEFIGDEVLWCVSNDLDLTRSTYTYGTAPMGLEQQMTVFGFNRTGDLGDMVFKKYTLINKGNLTLKDVILAYWSDTDLGDAADDYTGCDTVLKLGYTYNADNNDEKFYGTAPPAVGYVFFQGPIVEGAASDSAKFLTQWRHGYKNLPMTAFTFYINSDPTGLYTDPDLGVAAGSIQFYYYMTGKSRSGVQFVDPKSGQPTNIILSGDPVAGTGWYEGDKGWGAGIAAGDRRHLMSSGPFTMAPGDTQEVVVGIVIARGSNNLNSITELKKKTKTAQIAYDNDFNLTPAPDPPKVSSFSDDKQITLYWEPNSESYNEIDNLILGKGKTDTTYNFEGYRIWQFSDLSGANPTLLDIVDLKDSITKITQSMEINGVKVEQTVFDLPDGGLKRYFTTGMDKIKNINLVNGSPYYFAVTAFGYSPESDPKYLENPPQIFEVRPAAQPIDVTFDYANGDFIQAKQTVGSTDADINLFVVNPLGLNGSSYQVTFDSDSVVIRNFDNSKDSLVTLVYNLINTSKTPVDTLLNHSYELGKDSITNKLVTDGFSIVVRNTGLDSIIAAKSMKYRVKSVMETKGPGGKVLATPVDVFNGKTNSTKKWTIYPRSSLARLNWQSLQNEESMGYENYEIRFTDSSAYFLSGLTGGLSEKSLLTKTDSLCQTNKLPFEVWSLGRYDNPADAKRLFLKIMDKNAGLQDSTKAIPDRKWTQLASGEWEQVYAFQSSTLDYANLPAKEAVASKIIDHKIGGISFSGDLPEAGTVVKISGYKPILVGDEFTVTAPAANTNNIAAAKNNIEKISVFPNPYFGSHALEESKYNRFVRFIGLPKQATITIVSLSGVLVKRYEKTGDSQFLDWDLKNMDQLPVASGMYIAYIEVPGAGTKVLKIAIIQETQYLDRI